MKRIMKRSIPIGLTAKVDLRIDGRGFYSLHAETKAGREWYARNVMDDGEPYTDSQQYAYDLAQGATDDGLRVSVNGFIFLSGGLRGEAA